MRVSGCTNTNGRLARCFLHSDCALEQKTVELQKKQEEGFGFVLRGAKVMRVERRGFHILQIRASLQRPFANSPFSCGASVLSVMIRQSAVIRRSTAVPV
ncbi:hypothetical protein MHYP_G00119890 [Metynnis hypsauchen]